ncbi:DUF6440 family protein [Zavarzinella formosa]|uniref:DUF6440 family protein n=1 Tax=Zavarzinella formosa TaxID=360055 RepID=UPI0002DCE83B|nr:DUF6440 family protein [Zavarzinella formosa]
MSDLLSLILIWIIFSNLWHGSGRDDTDNPNDSRSGMMVYTDHRTGCQYLGTVFGGITPRLDRDGKPVCVVNEPKS